MGPLEGIKVLDLTSMVAGPVAAMMLGDQGAEVIKIEPVQGEQMRYLGPPHNGMSAGFFSCNRSKKSMALELKSDAGKQILWDLIATADVLMQNFRPGTMKRLGFSEEYIRQANPDLIYISMSGFGEKGPYAHKRAYDPIIQALSGATDIQADRITHTPAMFRIIIADKVTSLTAAQAVSSALFYRERSGKGQHIKLSMLDAVVSFFWPEGMAGLTYAEREVDVRQYQGLMDLIYEAKDGYITAAVISNPEWVGMCRSLNREDLIDDERFATALARMENNAIRKQITSDEISKWKCATILERLDKNDVPSAPLLSRMELLGHEQIVASGTIQSIKYEGFGEVRQAHPAARFQLTPSEIQTAAPQLGEHSDEILQALGYSQNKRQQLFADKVVTGALDKAHQP